MAGDAAIGGTAIVLSLSAAIGKDKQLNFQTGVPLDCPASELNEAIDKLMNAVARQEAKQTKELVEASIKTEKEVIDNMERDKLRVTNEYKRNWDRLGKKGEFALNDRQNKELAEFNENLASRRRKILEYEALVKTCEAKIQGN